MAAHGAGDLPEGVEGALEDLGRLQPAEPDVPVRRLHLRRRRGRRHRPGQGAAFHRGRRLRRADQPDDRRGPDPRRPGGGRRDRADGADRLRRPGQLHRRVVHGLPDPDGAGGAGLGAGRDGHAVAAPPDRRQGRRASRRPSARRRRSSTRSSTRCTSRTASTTSTCRARRRACGTRCRERRRRPSDHDRPRRARAAVAGGAPRVRHRDGRARAEPDERPPGDVGARACRRHRSRGSSAACAPRARCACTGCARWRRASRCCCGSCPTPAATSRSWTARSPRTTPVTAAGRWRSSSTRALPPPRVVVVGDAPVAEALRELAPHVGLEAAAPADGAVSISGEDLALVVASHGRDEEPALVAALTEGVPYVGLVASERRGAAVRASLDVRRRAARPPAHAGRGCRSARARPPRSRSRSSPRSCRSAARARHVARRCPRRRSRSRPRRTAAAAMTTERVTGLVLAAGGSRRLGQPKQLLPYRGRTLLDHTLDDGARVRLRPADLRGRRRCRRGPARRRPRRRRGRREPGLRRGLLVVDRRGAGGCRSAQRRARAAARRPARRARRDRRARCWKAAAARRSRSAATTTAAAIRSPSAARRSASSPRCTATRRSGSCWSATPPT